LAGGDLARLRALNALAVIRAVRDGAPLTLSEVANRTGLSRPAVEDIVGDVTAQGWIVEVPPVAGVMGRPARRYRFCSEAGHVLGVDVGAHRVRALVADLDGAVVGSHQVGVQPETSPGRRLAAMGRAARAAFTAAGLAPSAAWAVGIASTGVVDAKGRVGLSVVPGWTGVDLAAPFVDLGCPVYAANDCTLAARAEQWQGVAQDVTDMVYVLAGSRTGAGLVLGGRLHRGAGGAAGEIGFLSESRWARAQERLRGWSGVPADLPETDVPPFVFAAAREGDRGARSAVKGYARDLALGTAAVVLTVDPELVVLGGGFSRAADLLLEPLRAELDRLVIRPVEVRVSTLGENAAALGAVRHALDHVEERFFASEAGPLDPL